MDRGDQLVVTDDVENGMARLVERRRGAEEGERQETGYRLARPAEHQQHPEGEVQKAEQILHGDVTPARAGEIGRQDPGRDGVPGAVRGGEVDQPAPERRHRGGGRGNESDRQPEQQAGQVYGKDDAEAERLPVAATAAGATFGCLVCQ